MDKIKIGFDIDSVTLNYIDRFRKVFHLFGGKTDMSMVKEFNYFKAIQKDEHTALYMTFAYMMQEILPLEDGFEAMINFMLRERMQKMQFITARQPDLSLCGAKNSLETILSHMNVYPGNMKYAFSIDCVGDKGSHGSKVPKIQEYGFDYFMEDRRKNVLEISKAGVMVFMPRKTWNVMPEDTENVVQYDNPAEVVRYLRKWHK